MKEQSAQFNVLKGAMSSMFPKLLKNILKSLEALKGIWILSKSVKQTHKEPTRKWTAKDGKDGHGLQFQNLENASFRSFKIILLQGGLAKYRGNSRHLRNPKIRDKCMVERLEWTDYHTFVSYFQVISNVCHFVWPTALKLDYVTNFDMGFISLGDKFKFVPISN